MLYIPMEFVRPNVFLSYSFEIGIKFYQGSSIAVCSELDLNSILSKFRTHVHRGGSGTEREGGGGLRGKALRDGKQMKRLEQK